MATGVPREDSQEEKEAELQEVAPRTRGSGSRQSGALENPSLFFMILLSVSFFGLSSSASSHLLSKWVCLIHNNAFFILIKLSGPTSMDL